MIKSFRDAFFIFIFIWHLNYYALFSKSIKCKKKDDWFHKILAGGYFFRVEDFTLLNLFYHNKIRFLLLKFCGWIIKVKFFIGFCKWIFEMNMIKCSLFTLKFFTFVDLWWKPNRKRRDFVEIDRKIAKIAIFSAPKHLNDPSQDAFIEDDYLVSKTIQT